jgi:hypothetical protein
MVSVIALVSKVVGLNNLNLTTTRGDRLTEARPSRRARLRAGFDQATSYTTLGDTNRMAGSQTPFIKESTSFLLEGIIR